MDRNLERPNIYVVGDVERQEFAMARRWLANHAVPRFLPTLRDALRELADDAQNPAALVVAQTRTGQHEAALVERWQQLAGESPLILLLGTWSEGETRSGYPIKNVPRVPWYHFAPRMTAAFGEWPQTRECAFARFAATAEPDRLRAEVLAATTERSLQIGLVCGSPMDAEAYEDGLVRLGHDVQMIRNLQDAANVDVLVWDGSAHLRIPRTDLSRICTLGPPVIAMMTFPRIEECQAAYQSGCVAVLAKPPRLDDLQWSLAYAVSAKQGESQHSAA